ncbi:MAG: PilN domain-containing protein [bacterium]|nr:PilN domain-containing protein [bacterium]
MIEINLLPEEERKRKKAEVGFSGLSIKFPTNFAFFAIIGGSVLLLVILFIIHFVQVGSINQLNKKIGEKQAELKKLKEEVAKVDAMKQKEGEINAKIETIKKLVVGKFTYAKALDIFVSNLPDYLWIDELTIKNKKVVIKGKTFSNLMITDLMTNLKKQTEYFDAFILKDIVNKPESGYDIISFEINASFKQ